MGGEGGCVGGNFSGLKMVPKVGIQLSFFCNVHITSGEKSLPNDDDFADLLDSQ